MRQVYGERESTEVLIGAGTEGPLDPVFFPPLVRLQFLVRAGSFQNAVRADHSGVVECQIDASFVHTGTGSAC